MGRDSLMDKITRYEYEVLTNSWSGVAGAALWQAWEFCKEMGLIDSTKDDGTVVPSQKGLDAIKAYQANESYNRVDVI